MTVWYGKCTPGGSSSTSCCSRLSTVTDMAISVVKAVGSFVIIVAVPVAAAAAAAVLIPLITLFLLTTTR